MGNDLLLALGELAADNDSGDDDGTDDGDCDDHRDDRLLPTLPQGCRFTGLLDLVCAELTRGRSLAPCSPRGTSGTAARLFPG